MTLTGTYFRVREGSDIEALQIDWLVIAQVAACALGGLSGLLYMLRLSNWGLGVKSLAVFVIIALLSSAFNPYPSKVLGYWILLAGSSLLTMRLVYSADNIEFLYKIEKIWLFTMIILTFKDVFIGLFIMRGPANSYDEVSRLGMGVTHANFLSFNAAVAFWLSFRNGILRLRLFIIWVIRGLLVFTILMARSRMALICLLLGAVIRIWLVPCKESPTAKWYRRLAILTSVICLIIGFSLALSLRIDYFVSFFHTISRGESSEKILSVTGRTDIWAIAVDKIFENPVSFIFGHGYGMSRFVLNDGPISLNWYAYHAHNAFLEVLLSMGFIGFCAFMAMISYSLKWAIDFNQLQTAYTTEFALRAAPVIAMILLYSITEAELATKIGPIFLIFIFYLLALDREKSLLSADLPRSQ